MGKTSILWLLADFLNHTGFDLEINSQDIGDDTEVLAQMVTSIPDRLDAIIAKDTLIVLNEVQTRRTGVQEDNNV